jgi:hypothetical protein
MLVTTSLVPYYVIQRGKPVAYYLHKLNSAQKNYTTMEKELLLIVATFKEFHTMIYGANITVYTDHKNLTFHNLSSQRVMRWHNFLEEYSPKFIYIEGPLNVLADAFSRVPRAPSTVRKNDGPKPTSESYFFSFHFDDDDMLDCFLSHLPLEDMQYPLNYTLLQTRQFEDERL